MTDAEVARYLVMGFESVLLWQDGDRVKRVMEAVGSAYALAGLSGDEACEDLTALWRHGGVSSELAIEAIETIERKIHRVVA